MKYRKYILDVNIGARASIFELDISCSQKLKN